MIEAGIFRDRPSIDRHAFSPLRGDGLRGSSLGKEVVDWIDTVQYRFDGHHHLDVIWIGTAKMARKC
jgi:hypothetical protein